MDLENINCTDQEPDIADNLPRISIIIPFVQKMNTKTGFDYIVNAAADKCRKRIDEKLYRRYNCTSRKKTASCATES